LYAWAMSGGPAAIHRKPLTILVVMFTASGLLVRFLKVFEKSGYQSVKWVRYLSKANGSYQIRVSRIFGLGRCFGRGWVEMFGTEVE
jgi:hypothetical protein